ncbi:ATP-binding protein [Breoghania sp.]|uniref:sensor histidine kinase n=1 Tax=Breoghania sp. TaxID=2065378 RepID=UPI002AA7344F|nr:ATP-binding protein [Breoghania sp.]
MLKELNRLLDTSAFSASGDGLTPGGGLMAMHIGSDLLVLFAFVLVPGFLLYALRRRPRSAQRRAFPLFLVFILIFGIAHLALMVTLWNPLPALAWPIGALAVATTLAAFAVAWFTLPRIVRLPGPARLRGAQGTSQTDTGDPSRTNRTISLIQEKLRENLNSRAREIENKTAELERANESLRRFAHIASHDLQEPLRKIAAYADILEQAIAEDDPEEATRAMERLRAMSSQARTMVADLLRFSKMSQYKPAREPIDLRAAVEEIAEIFEHRISGQNGSLDISLPDLHVRADPLLLRQIFQNILANAVKYVPETRAPSVAIKAVEGDACWKITITDNGIGFDPALKSKIFEPFTRLHGRKIADGSGIGLAIVYRAVHDMEWAIDVETQPDKGTTFCLWIPKSDVTLEKAEPAPAAASS